MQIILTNHLQIQNASPSVSRQCKDRLTLVNPAWLENDKMGRWQGETPYTLRYYEEVNSGLILPRGFFPQLINIARSNGERFEIEDRRSVLPEIEFQFDGQLRPFQEKAVKDLLTRDTGTLAAPTGAGKTIVALWMIVQRKQPSLIIVHTKELLNQWIDRIEKFLGIPANEIGRIGDGERNVGRKITVALVQTLYKCSSQISPHIGYLVIDECHRTPARTFTEAVNAFDCKYITGLSATPWRKDQLSKLIFWYGGNVLHEIKKGALIESGDVLSAEVVWRQTDFLRIFLDRN